MRSHHADDLTGTPFRAVRELGRGGMGVVFEAIDQRNQAACAVKVIRGEVAPDLIDRFRLEWETLAKGQSPHFVRVLDGGRSPSGVPYYAMELLAGRTARDESRARGPLPLEDVLALGIQILDGLAAAHALGVVHRDIKPENIFLTGDGKPRFVKLLDFGIAKVTTPTRDGPTPLAVPTAEGLMVGTLRWAAPEILLCSGVDERTDLYSAGLVIWSLASGRVAWADAVTQEDLILAQMRDPLPSLVVQRSLPAFEPLDALLASLTKKPKEERLGTAREAASALRKILGEQSKSILRPVVLGEVPRLEPVAPPEVKPAVRAPSPQPAAGRGSPAMVTFPQLSPGQRFEGRYEIDRHIGKGGMGTVYRAKQTFLSREVAIKLIPLEARAVNVDLRAQFAIEMQVLARLDHPNIVKIFDGGVTDDNMAYIVMELLPGISLRAGLTKGMPLKPLKACMHLSQVAQGLMALHSIPILHRDIKPENIMVMPDGAVKIVDFGLARVRTSSKYATRNPNATGTLHYMPKEQLMNEPLDESVDVFAFGLVLFECFTGAHPRATESGSFQNARETIVSVVEGKPIVALRGLRPDLPEELLLLADQCVSLDPSKRPKPREIVDVLARVTLWAKSQADAEAARTPAPPVVADGAASPAAALAPTTPLPDVVAKPAPKQASKAALGRGGTVKMVETPVQAVDNETTDRMVTPGERMARVRIESEPSGLPSTSPLPPLAAPIEERTEAFADAPFGDRRQRANPPSRIGRHLAVAAVVLSLIAVVLIAVEVSVPGTLVPSRAVKSSAAPTASPGTTAASATPIALTSTSAVPASPTTASTSVALPAASLSAQSSAAPRPALPASTYVAPARPNPTASARNPWVVDPW